MTQTKPISPARQAMLDLIKFKRESRSKSSSSSSSSSSNDSDKNHQTNNQKKKAKPLKYNEPVFKKELDHYRRQAYIVRLGGKMI